MPSELPRRYTSEELAAIQGSIAPYKIDSCNIERLQKAAELFQRKRLEESNRVSLSRSRRRKVKLILKLIIRLCEERAPESEIKSVLDFARDVLAFRYPSPVEISDHLKLKQTAEFVLAEIAKRGRKPTKARREFIGFLIDLSERTTLEIRGRSVHDGERGDLRKFVIAVLKPFKATHHQAGGGRTGLGLSISHDIIVKQHGGSIEVDTQPGAYTEFRTILPRETATIGEGGKVA